MQIAPRLIWLASYPKSGNTWLRFLLANFLWGPITDSAQIDRHIPDIHHQFPLRQISTSHGLGFVKTHQPTPAEVPYPHMTDGAVYIVRNPLDVIASLLHYAAVPEDKQSAFVDHAIHYHQSPLWREFGAGAWADHVTHWALDPAPERRLVLFYENLLADPEHNLSRILDFLDVPNGALSLAEAVRRSSFANLKALEEAERTDGADGFFAKERATAAAVYGSDRLFMRGGTAGGHQAVFSSDQITQAIHAFMPLWQELIRRHNDGIGIPLTRV